LKAQQEANNTLPAPSPQSLSPTPGRRVGVRGGRKKWAAAAAFLLAVLALAVTELAGVTHLFRGQEPTPDPSKPGGEPTPAPVVKQEARPPTFTKPAPSIHDHWIEAVAGLPLDKLGAVAAAKLKERNPGFEDTLLRSIPAMSADRQAIMVEAWLRDRNPGFA